MSYIYHSFLLSNFSKKKILKIIVILFSVLIFISFYSLKAPIKSQDVVIGVSKNRSVTSIGNELKQRDSIRSVFLFKLFFKLFDNSKMLEGDYLVYKNTPVFSIAKQFAYGKYNIDQTKITLREGLTNKEMAQILKSKLNNFDEDVFLNLVKEKQGYLFPDTYSFSSSISEEGVVEKMELNFEKKIKSLKIEKNINLNDVIKMASILEGEASGEEDAYIISGILWKRLKIGMFLQVDVDMNTYKEKGLPREPLNNPGLSFIKAALNPKDSPYFYYIHDKKRNVYFSKNYEEHKININKYLR